MKNVKQRYTYLGLLIVLAMALIAAWLVTELFTKPKASERRARYTTIEEALRMQCAERDGQLAIGNGPQGTYISCHQGQRQIWMVRQ